MRKQNTRRMFLAVLAAGVWTAGCRKKAKIVRVPRTPPPPELRIGGTQRGIASWYGHPYHGRRAANGEVYDMNQMTAAHLTLPFDTVVEVTNLGNGLRTEVRITDRGPFIDGRILDLSHEAARRLELIGPGTGEVEVKIVALPQAKIAEGAGPFAVQTGAFADHSRAEILRKDLERRFGFAQLVLRRGNPDLWRVLAGKLETEQEAERLAQTLRAESGAAFVVHLDVASQERMGR